MEDALINLVQSFNLSVGIANSFLAKLKAAHAAGPGRAMCTNLDDFITEVQSQSGKKLATSQANQLNRLGQSDQIRRGLPVMFDR